MKILPLMICAALAWITGGCVECNSEYPGCVQFPERRSSDGSTATDTTPSVDARPEDSTHPRDDGNGDVGTEDALPDSQHGDAANDAQIPPSDVGPTDGPILVDGPLPIDGPVLVDGPLPIDGAVPPPDGGNCDHGCIAQCTPSPELCDGLDNDCDDETDEDFIGLNAECFAGRGVCQAVGLNVCSEDHQSVVCNAQLGLPSPEICDSMDNDCDGDIDENLGNESVSCGVGACVHNVTVCDGGNSAECDPFEGATAEVCDGIDNNCDGDVDEGVINACGNCGSLPLEVCDQQDNNCNGQTDEGGVCNPVDAGPPPDAAPPADAAADAAIDACVPADEICDQQDNNCDGQTDEGGVCNPVDAGPPPDAAPPADAAADAAIDACIPSDEICDEQDNDCDGQIDEDVLNACGTCGQIPPETCNDLDDDCDGVTDEESNVVCHCDGRPDMPYMQICQGGVLQPCPCAEVCNGVDDDSNGTVDDVAGLGQPCSQGIGACQAQGQTVCQDGHTACDAVPRDPGIEICNGLDDDCDGTIDNNPSDAGQICHQGIGACERAGVTVCGAQGITCNAVPGQPVNETCNEIDDDCDGQVDEICPGRVNIPIGDVINRSNQRVIGVPAFWIGRNETTVADYAICVSAGACSLPTQGANYNWSIQEENYPINGVNWQQAQTYCQWTGGDLPTDLQWIRAARGDTAANYPWGLAPPPDCQRAQLGNCLPFESVQIGLHSPTGDSPYGLADMIGNVEEWTSIAAGPPNTRLVAGGSWRKNPGEPGLRITEMIGRAQADPSDTIGFRCVWPAQ